MTINISAEYARLIQPFTSTDPTRCYLQGFYVEPCSKGGVYVVATNSHIMGIFHDETGTCDKPEIIQLPKAFFAALKDLRKQYKRLEDKDFRLVVEGNTASLGIGEPGNDFRYLMDPQTFPKVTIDGVFPSWQRVIPRDIDPANPWITGSYNASYIEAIASVGNSKNKSVRLVGKGPVDPALAYVPYRSDFFAVIMPIRDNEMDRRLPDWLE